MALKVGNTIVIDDSRNVINISNTISTTANVTTELNVPVGTTETRPVTPGLGSLRYNTTTVKMEIYNGTTWTSL